ncbi:MAG TPA: DNA-processing protein DprA [Flavisolibacter sp.]|jgi:DNA processing protein|nr:DNA-processing protein DprA [Flavisolibacter sp.]
MHSELFYQLALTLVPNIGDVHAKTLVQHFGDATSIFKAKQSLLEKIEGIGEIRAKAIKHFNEFHIAETELQFIEKYKIKPLFLTDEAYPKRLLNCYDSPTMLFYKGSADLNAAKVVAIVGTRSNTDYGKAFTEGLVRDLAAEGVVIVSGLAFGIDAIAHKASLKNSVPTIGVVGHGLNKIYPSQHAALAKEMIASGGGLLSEFFHDIKPDKHNFPLRNRIVAGMSDATILVETAVKGGSMITAKLADGYNRDVFAVPGRTTDKVSAGCNHLIKYNKAILLTDAAELLEVMGWKEKKTAPKKQRELFIELSPEEETVFKLLQTKEAAHIDEINVITSLSSSTVAAAILNLELQGIVQSQPGKMYKLV